MAEAEMPPGTPSAVPGGLEGLTEIAVEDLRLGAAVTAFSETASRPVVEGVVVGLPERITEGERVHFTGSVALRPTTTQETYTYPNWHPQAGQEEKVDSPVVMLPPAVFRTQNYRQLDSPRKDVPGHSTHRYRFFVAGEEPETAKNLQS